MTDSQFVFAVCQVGAEAVLKNEISAAWPSSRPAFSRPGYLTFKFPASPPLAPDFDLKSIFARSYGISLGKVSGTEGHLLLDRVRELAAGLEIDQLHVFERDRLAPGEHGFEPGITPLASEIGALLERELPGPRANARARVGQLVLDVALVEPNEWWVGYHRAASMPSRWPGGVCQITPAEGVVSRAYYKMHEALLWSRLPVARDDRAVEIGSSPGGSCQALLEKGLFVTGIDPAEMDETLLAHPRFRHLRKRSAEVKRREFRGVKWLMADSNVAPAYTLDAVEAVVTHREARIRGMLLTLKLLEWGLAAEIPQYLARIRSWGFEHIRARQLAFDRREICVAAMRSRSMRREAPWQVKQRSSHKVGTKTTTSAPQIETALGE